MSAAWETLGATAPGELAEARAEAQWAVQVAASVGHTLLDPTPDGAHLALVFDPESRGLVGPAWCGVRVGVRPEDYALYLYDEDLEELEESTLRGRTLAQGLEFLTEMLVDAADQDLPRPLELPARDALPAHPVGDGEAFGMRTFESHLELGRWCASGHALLASLAGDGAAPRFCARRFELGIPAEAVEVGLSLGDAVVGEPHLFVRPLPAPGGDALPALELGSWRREGWTGAVLTGAELVAAGDAAAQEARARAFLEGAQRAVEPLR